MDIRKLALCASFASLVSCGDNGETVFMYFIHAYAGSENASLIGETGPLVNNAKFGERHGNDGACSPEPEDQRQCIPKEYDRQLGGGFQVLLDGQPDVPEVMLPLADMYPQETATAILKKRTGTSSADVVMFRHLQSVSSTCTLTMVNSLSLNNNPEIQSVPEQFSFIPEFTFEDPAFAGYLPNEADLPIPTECGNLPTDEPEHQIYARTDIASRVAASPWFLPVECDDDNTPGVDFCFAWGPPTRDGRSFIDIDTMGVVERTTREFHNCMRDAISFETESASPVPTGETSCPEGDLSWDDANVDTLAAQECREALLVDVLTVSPSQTLSFIYFDNQCSTHFRVRTPGQDVIFINEEDDSNDRLVETDRSLEPGSELFWVLFGRPVNPLLWSWDSANQVASLEDFPYFNGQDDRIGELD